MPLAPARETQTRAGRNAAHLALLLFFLAFGNPAPSAAGGLLAQLSKPDTVLLLRHALAPGTGDPAGFRLDDCNTQRNLSEAGRAQARKLGERLREAGIGEARVYSSRWCRALETAELLDLGPVEALPAIDSFFQQRVLEPERTRRTRQFLVDLPPGLPVILVTHQVNVAALTGEFTGSGTGVVARILPDGRLESLGLLR